MSLDPSEHRRRSIRLPAYDYAGPGAYFVTICTHNRDSLFGQVGDGEMRLNRVGEMVSAEWLRMPVVRPKVVSDAFVVMPNHMHGIIILGDDSEVGATRRVAPTCSDRARGPTPGSLGAIKVGATRRVAPTCSDRARGPAPGSLGAIVGQFKSLTAKRINERRSTPGAPVWQRNYYEHVIRNEKALNAIRRYVLGNPLLWDYDTDNLASQRQGVRMDRATARRCGLTDWDVSFIAGYEGEYHHDTQET
jgi:REP element-mobilizing transposase RayT